MRTRMTRRAASALLHCMVRDAGPRGRRPRVQRARRRDRPEQLPGLPPHRPAGRRIAGRRLSPRLRSRRRGRPRRGAARRLAHRDRAGTGDTQRRGRTPTLRPNSCRHRSRTGARAALRWARVAGARSGDKGGNANLGVWARDDAAWRWLAHTLTRRRAAAICSPKRPAFPVRRHVLRQSARAELRHRGPARRRRRVVDALRPAGQGAR